MDGSNAPRLEYATIWGKISAKATCACLIVSGSDAGAAHSETNLSAERRHAGIAFRAAPSMMFMTVHSMEDACRVLAAMQEAGDEVTHRIGLISAPGAAGYMGPRLWRAMIEAVERETGALVHDVLDCGAQAGWASAALRAGQKRIVLSRSCPQFEAINLLADEYGAEIAEKRPDSFRIGPQEGLEELVRFLRQGYVAIGAGVSQRSGAMPADASHEEGSGS